MQIFGFTIGGKGKKLAQDVEQKLPSFAIPVDDDGASTVSNAVGHFGTFIDLDGAARTESELISRYRETAKYPDCDTAVEEVCSEAISTEDDEDVVKLNLDDVPLSKNIRNVIEEEFDEILNLLDFDSRAHDIFRRYYVDGRIYYHKLFDPKNPGAGIQELRYVDPRKIKKIREVEKKKDETTGVEIYTKVIEYFVYSENGFSRNNGYTAPNNTAQGVKIAPEAITYVTSGLIDLDRNIVLSHLDKAIKPTNMLRMAEDSMLIYRMARAPERRVFYVDVGNLPNNKAEQYLKNIMNRFRTKIVYDASTGELQDDRKHMSMMEDFWLPRREGGQGTQVDTLEGAQNLGVVDDINYYQTKLYNALNVPVSRMQGGNPLNFGRQMEVTRDELKFAKFISRLRRKFSEIFDDLLKTQLILKGVITPEDWDEVLKPKIKYVFASDIYWAEAKEIENLRNRVEILTELDPYIGVYYSKEWVRKNVLKQSDEEIEEIESQIEAEREVMATDADFMGQLAAAKEMPTMQAQADVQTDQQMNMMQAQAKTDMAMQAQAAKLAPKPAAKKPAAKKK
jgi:hypothetical protein